MFALRRLLLRHRAVAAALIALALAMKIVVPQGMMIGGDSRVLAISMCDGIDHAAAPMQPVLVKITPAGDNGKSGTHATDHQACPFATLAHATLGGADPVQLALALAFILLTSLCLRQPLALQGAFHLRPPLRAPPIPA